MKNLMTVIGGAALVAAVVAPAAAQSNAVAEALATEAHANENNMVSAAEAMPAEKYAFRPTPAQNPFGQLIFHAGQANYALCGVMAGEKAPEATVKADGAKDALIKQMQDSFEYCYKVFPKVDASRLGDKVTMFGRQMTIAWVVVHTALDWGDHYGQVANYLRAAGIAPPSSQRRGRGEKK
ncbi:MAG: DinB family protein [Betaproteobacteria bacterium]